jgi:hypothetical protein
LCEGARRDGGIEKVLPFPYLRASESSGNFVIGPFPSI